MIKPTDPDFKTKAFERIVARLRNVYRVGMRVRLAGTKDKGVIQKINYTPEDVTWDKNHPLFIEVLLDNGERVLCGSHQLSKKRAK